MVGFASRTACPVAGSTSYTSTWSLVSETYARVPSWEMVTPRAWPWRVASTSNCWTIAPVAAFEIWMSQCLSWWPVPTVQTKRPSGVIAPAIGKKLS